MNPIPGQPGLFRQDSTLDARRTAMSSLGNTFFTNPPLPPPPYTWGFPRTGRPWTIGGLETEVAATARSLASATAAFDKLKRGLDPFLRASPFSAPSYDRIARFIASARGPIRLTQDQFTQIARGMLSSTSAALILAGGLLIAPTTSAQVARAAKLIERANRTMQAFLNALSAVRAAQSAASRATGLGAFVVDDGVLVLAALAAGALVFIVSAGILYLVIAEQQATAAALEEAERACALDASQGRPCTPEAFQAAVRRARETQNEYGLFPNLNELFKQAGSLLFWGGLLAVGAVLGYAAWTAEPARRNVEERLRRASSPTPSPERDEARWYNGPQGR